MVDEALGEPIDGSFDRSTVGREGKSTTRVSICSSKNKILPLVEVLGVISLSPGSWLPLREIILYQGLSVGL